MSKDLRSEPMRKAEIGIITASREGKLDIVMRLVQNEGIPTDYQESEGGPTPLMTAAIGGFIAIIIFLLNPGPGIKPAEINKQDREQRTALINAVLNNKDDCVTLLMENGADPNLYSRNGWTPLYIAVNRGFTEIARALLLTVSPLDLDMVIQNTTQYIVVAAKAAENGNMEIAGMLMHDGNGTFPLDDRKLFVAAQQGYANSVRSLLDHGADVTAVTTELKTPLHIAAEAGNSGVVEVLLSHPLIHVNALDMLGRTPLFVATLGNHLDAVIALLMDSRVDMCIADNMGEIAINVSTSQEIPFLMNSLHNVKYQERAVGTAEAHTDAGHIVEQVMPFLAGRAEPPPPVARVRLQVQFAVEHGTPLMRASASGDVAAVGNLLDGSLDRQDLDGWSALHHAVWHHHVAIVFQLLVAGASVNLRNKSGRTPLYCACLRGFADVIEILLQAEADPNIQCNSGDTALTRAASDGHRKIVNLLLRGGNHGGVVADRDVRNDSGFSALHRAVASGHTSCVVALLGHP